MVLASSVPTPPSNLDLSGPASNQPPFEASSPPAKSFNKDATPKKNTEATQPSARITAHHSPRCTTMSALPPTPITNPEKFGIRHQDSNKLKGSSPTSATESPTSPSNSQTSVDLDNLDGIVSVDFLLEWAGLD